MSLKFVVFLPLVFLFFHNTSQGQNTLSVEEQLAQLESEMDSSSLFTLFDSLLRLENQNKSELNVRLSYNNNVLTAGRNYGINQHGLSSGLSYYHQSGVYSSVAGYWNSAFTPKYSLTIASIGYMKFLSKGWSTSASYDRWIYNKSDAEASSYASFKNSINFSGAYTSKHFYGSLDYNYLFGSETAHRLIGSLSGYLSWRNLWFFERIKVLPSVSLIFGNEVITTIYAGDLRDAFRQNEYLRENLQSPAFRQFLMQVALTDEEQNRIDKIKNNQKLTVREKARRTTTVYLSNAEVAYYVRSSLSKDLNRYGIMNYSFSAPILFSIKNFTMSINYTYSIPLNLPGETADLTPVGYFSTGISYRIPMR